MEHEKVIGDKKYTYSRDKGMVEVDSFPKRTHICSHQDGIFYIDCVGEKEDGKAGRLFMFIRCHDTIHHKIDELVHFKGDISVSFCPFCGYKPKE